MSLSIYQLLVNHADSDYKKKAAIFCPRVNPKTIIGVRSPAINQIARTMSPTEQATFLASRPHQYLEENLLHALLLGKISDVYYLKQAIKDFLPDLNSWAVTDKISSSVHLLKKHPLVGYEIVTMCLADDQIYSIRLGIVLLLGYYLEQNFDQNHLSLVGTINNDDYYVQMAQAWYFSVALIKQYGPTKEYLLHHSLNPKVAKMTYRKVYDSFRLSKEQKKIIKSILQA